MTLVRWNPTRDLSNLEKEFNRLFRNVRSRFDMDETNSSEKGYESSVWSPLADISENDDNFVVKLDLPGVDKKDIKISYNDGELTVSGERKQENESKDSKYHRIERSYGKYFRTFALPKKVKEKDIAAEFKDGQLTITLPKSEEAKPKEIEVKVS